MGSGEHSKSRRCSAVCVAECSRDRDDRFEGTHTMADHAAICARCQVTLPPGARFCPACGAPATAAPAAASPPAGERRQVAVLFADLAGYTRLSSTLDAEEVHRILTRYFELADGAVERLGGTIDKHVGDAVMAVFGAPVAHGNDVERALRAALEIHAGMAALAAALGRPLAAHVGIANGEVVAAATGSDAHRAYTVTGDAVNLAARLTDIAAAGETVISDDVHRAVAAFAEVEAGGEVAIRGLPAPQRVWKLRALRARGAARAPLVGRDAERRRFVALLHDAAARGIGAIVLLSADPGMGKTRLAESFLAAALAEGAFCHAATVLDFGAGKDEDAAHALVASLLDAPHASAAARRDALGEAIAQGRAAADDEPFLADLLALPQAAGSLYDAMDNEARRQGKLAALVDVVERAAARAPCVLLVEDVHWASPWVLACLEALGGVTADHPVVLLMTTRREGAAAGVAWPAARTTRIDLAPLAAADALALARLHFATSADLAQRCVDRAQGNPLFLVQLLRSGTDDDAVPASIQSVVLARLDRLPPADKRAVQAAAVIGQHFGVALLRTMLDAPDYNFAVAIERDLVRPIDEEPGMLMFTHALIRDGAYASLLHAARRELHRAAADWYAGRDAPLRARHLDRAEDPAAATAYLEAARSEADALRLDDALALARRGSELPASPAVRHALAKVEGDLCWALGRAAASIAAFERALGAAADERERCAAWIGIAASHRLTSAVEPGLAALEQAAALAGDSAPDAARVHYLRGSFHFARGDVDGCRAEHERSLACAEAAGDPEAQAEALSGLADALYAQGRFVSARATFERCVALCHAAGLTRISIANRCMIGFIDAYFGEPDAALASIAAARRDARGLRNRVAEVMAVECEASVLVACGRFAAAREVLAEALALAREVGARRFETFILVCLARVERHDGDGEAAQRYASEAWQLAQTVDPHFAGPIALAAVAAAAATAEERARALADAERLLAEGCLAHCHIEFYGAAIDLALDAGDWAEVERYASALERFMRHEPLPLATFFIARGRALAAAGRGHADRDALAACRRDAVARQFLAGVPALDAAIAACP